MTRKKRLNVGDTAPRITVLNTKEEEIMLDESFWAQGPHLLSFLRHFG